MAAGPAFDVVIQNPNRYPEAGSRRFAPWLARVLAAVAPEHESLGVRFAGDREVRRVNRAYRGQDKPTDVLSFPGTDGHLGDILISVPTARRQAESRGGSTERELKVLLLHGVLHCLGYDHEADRGTMRSLERRWGRKLIDDESHA